MGQHTGGDISVGPTCSSLYLILIFNWYMCAVLASPAENAGLQPGDCVVRVNNQNVSRSQAVSVAKLVK